MKLSLKQIEQAFEIAPGLIDLTLAAKLNAVGFVLYYAARDDGIDAKDALRLLIKQPQEMVKVLDLLNDAEIGDVCTVVEEYHPLGIDLAPGVMLLMAWAANKSISKITRRLPRLDRTTFI